MHVISNKLFVGEWETCVWLWQSTKSKAR